jgi:hypothetical protein
MKKTLIVLALAMVSFANAQKGSILVMGSVGFDSSKQEFGTTEDKTNTFNFSPKVGYQFNDNWTVGIEGSVAGSKDDHTALNGAGILETSTDKTTTFRVGPFVRYSKPLNETFSAYVDMGVGFQSAKMTSETPAGPFGTLSVTQKGDGVYVGITPAIFINVKKNFGLNFSIGGLGYETFNLNNNGGDNSHFYLNFGQTVNIGISKNF